MNFGLTALHYLKSKDSKILEYLGNLVLFYKDYIARERGC